MFGELLEALAHEHSPLAIDLPGHGRSGGIDSLGSIERMADFVAAFLDKWGIARAVWLGHSMGGAVALRAALERPERVRAVVLCASAAALHGRRHPRGRPRRRGQGAAARSSAKRTRRRPRPRCCAAGFLEDLKTDPRVLLGDLEACRAFDALAELPRVAAPTLVVVGDDEDPALRERSRELAHGLIRGATLCTVAGRGAHAAARAARRRWPGPSPSS